MKRLDADMEKQIRGNLEAVGEEYAHVTYGYAQTLIWEIDALREKIAALEHQVEYYKEQNTMRY